MSSGKARTFVVQVGVLKPTQIQSETLLFNDFTRKLLLKICLNSFSEIIWTDFQAEIHTNIVYAAAGATYIVFVTT